jgi:hypothetical protein
VAAAGAILDRFLHHAQTIAIPGGVIDLKTAPPLPEKRTKIKRSKPSPTNL